MNKEIIILLLIHALLAMYIAYRFKKAFEISLYIIQNHTKLALHLPDFAEMVISIKPLKSEYWLNRCVLNYARSKEK